MVASRTLHLQVDRAAPRLDQFLAQEIPHLSRSQIKKLIQQNQVLIDNHPVKPNAEVRPGDLITLHLPADPPTDPVPQPIALDIIYADDELIVVNKAAGMVVHPAHGHTGDTLVNALLAQFPDLADLSGPNAPADRAGIVHRLDQDTSGLMVVARTPEALRVLQQQFKARTVEKVYLALVVGHPAAPEGVIEVPLGRDLRHRQKFAPRADGKPARTRYRVKSLFDQYALLEIGLETGRTHQIRVHLAWLGHPVVGDTLYGPKRNKLGLTRQFLHAWQLGFEHPRHHTRLSFEAPLPPNLESILTRLT